MLRLFWAWEPPIHEWWDELEEACHFTSGDVEPGSCAAQADPPVLRATVHAAVGYPYSYPTKVHHRIRNLSRSSEYTSAMDTHTHTYKWINFCNIQSEYIVRVQTNFPSLHMAGIGPPGSAHIWERRLLFLLVLEGSKTQLSLLFVLCASSHVLPGTLRTNKCKLCT